MVKYEDSVLITAIMESKIIFSILSIKLLLLGTSGIGTSAFADDLILIDTTALLLATVQTNLAWIVPLVLSAAWIISVILAGIGIGIVIARKL